MEDKVKITGFTIFLLLLITCGIVYLCYSDYRKTNATETATVTIDSTRRILILKVSDSANSYSDETQVTNVLHEGGTIILESFSGDSVDKVFSESWKQYGGCDAEGYHFIDGALLTT